MQCISIYYDSSVLNDIINDIINCVICGLFPCLSVLFVCFDVEINGIISVAISPFFFPLSFPSLH